MEPDTHQQLSLPAAIQADIIAHAREGWPEEVCGILSGKDGAATSLVRARNAAEDRQINYTVDPQTLVRQFDFEEAGEEMIAIYHSHPSSAAYPSATDARQRAPEFFFRITYEAEAERVVRKKGLEPSPGCPD